MSGAFILDGADRTSLQLLRSFKNNSVFKSFRAQAESTEMQKHITQ
jgi:hypothetical protein